MSLEVRTEEEVNEEIEAGPKKKRSPYVFPVYSALLIFCLVIVFAAQEYFDANSRLAAEGLNSVVVAGLVKKLFFTGEYWRLLTSAVVHGGILHLLMNCYAFFVLGRLFETLSNRNHLATVFFLSSLGSGALSLMFLGDYVPTVGASGGIAGFLGYLAVYGYKRRKLLTSAFVNNMLFNIGFMIVIGVMINATSAGGLKIDNYGHIGGLLTGAAYGLFQVSGDIYKDPREISRASRIIGIFSLVTIIGVCAFAIFVLLTLA